MIKWALIGMALVGTHIATAQQKLELEAGTMQRWNLGTQLGGEEINQSQNTTYRTKLKYGLGNGNSINLRGRYYAADSSPFFVSIEMCYFNSGLNRFAENIIDSSGYNSYALLQLRQWSINPSIGIAYSVANIKTETSIGLLLPMLSNTAETITSYSNNNLLSLEKRNIAYNFGVGLRISERILLHSSNHWNLSIIGEIGLLKLYRKNRVLNSYSDNFGNTASTKYSNLIDQRLEYIKPNTLEQGQKLNDPVFDPLNYDVSKPRQAFEFDENMSYLGLGLSLNYLLFSK